MKIVNKIFACIALSMTITACQDTDITPRSILTDEDIFNEGGIKAFMAGMYNRLPIEDFNMGSDDGAGNHGGFYVWNNAKPTMCSTGEFWNIKAGNSMVYGDFGYWGEAYQIIRQCNKLLESLPAFEGELVDVPEWIAETRFLRAYTYFALVKRYGGVPLIDRVQNIDENLLLPRSSHEDCVDFILADLDYAMTHMGTKKVNGRANRYVAAAFKSRVALYAGSVARYGSAFAYTGEKGTLLCGLPERRANEYFRQAYEAAQAVDAGGYALENGSDKRQAFYNVFDNAASSKESIFIREYDLNNYVHSWDQMMAPTRMVSSYGGRYHVPLDWVELFDGLPIDPNTGFLKTTDDDGYYLVYDSNHALFDNAEPRLKASIMIPGETYKGYELDLRSGLLVNVKPTNKISKQTADDAQTTYTWDAARNSFKYRGKVVAVRGVTQPRIGTTYNPTGKDEDDTGIAINGLDGPINNTLDYSTITGIYGVKHLLRDLPNGETALHRSYQPWIDIRYAEVLLNRAEAATELAQTGESDAATLLQDAYNCINLVRERAGATLLTSPSQLADLTEAPNHRGTGYASWIFAPNKGLHIIRVERYKELAVENKLYWDLRRWFTAHEQMYNYRYRLLAPYLFLEGATVDSATGIPHGQYIFDTRVVDAYNGNHTFDSKYYYERIPDGERKNNYLLEQNNRY